MDFGIKKSIRKYPNREPSVIEENPNRNYIQFWSIDKHKEFKNARAEEKARNRAVARRLLFFKHKLDDDIDDYERLQNRIGFRFSLTKQYSEEEWEEIKKEEKKHEERLSLVKGVLDNKIKKYNEMQVENTLAFENQNIYYDRRSLDHFQIGFFDRQPLPGPNKPPTTIPIPPPDPLLLEAEQKRDAFLAEQFRKAKKRHAKYNNNNNNRF